VAASSVRAVSGACGTRLRRVGAGVGEERA
jgi:hypothetical protein